MKETNPRPSLRRRLNNNSTFKTMKKKLFYSLPLLFTAVLITLKLTNKLPVPWYIVFFPLWGPASLILWLLILSYLFNNDEK